MRATITMAALTFALSACTTIPRAPAEAGTTIRYETAPCFGTCPVYAVTVRPDGSGTFEGKRFTAVTGIRAFTATPEQVGRFAAALAPYRPVAGERLYRQGSPWCGNEIVTDMPGVDVRWTGADGAEQHIDFYFGCDIEKNAAMRDALKSAPDALPIEAFVKPDRPFPPGR